MTMFFGVLLGDAIGLTAPAAGVALPLLATQILKAAPRAGHLWLFPVLHFFRGDTDD